MIFKFITKNIYDASFRPPESIRCGTTFHWNNSYSFKYIVGENVAQAQSGWSIYTIVIWI